MYGQEPDQDDQMRRALAQYAQMQGQNGMNAAQQGMQIAPQSPMMQRPAAQPMPAQAMGAQNPYAQSQAANAAAMQAAQRVGAGAPMAAMGGPAGAAGAMGAAIAQRPPMPPQAQGVPQRPAMPPGVPGGPGGLPAAAAKGAGAATAGVPMAAVVMQYLDKQRQNAEMARQARERIMAQQAGANGYPGYGIAAAQTRDAMNRNEGQDYLSPLLKYFGRGG